MPATAELRQNQQQPQSFDADRQRSIYAGSFREPRVLQMPRYESFIPRAKLQYDIQLDIDRIKKIIGIRESEPQRFQQEIEGFNAMTTFNLVTMLGERLNAGISRRTDILEDGMMKDAKTKEPLVDMYEKGRKHRAENGSSTPDQLREQTEVDLAKNVQEMLKKAKVGQIILSDSQPGAGDSIYKHNFYDMYVKTSDSTIEVSRYSSGLDIKEILDQIRFLDPTHPFANLSEEQQAQITDIDLLKHPIAITSPHFQSAKDVHAFLHKEHDSMSEDDFALVKDACSPLINHLIITLGNSPDSRSLLERQLKAIMIHADTIADSIQMKGRIKTKSDMQQSSHSVGALLHLYSDKKVRQVMAGCGISGDANSANGANPNNPFSVKDFAETKDDHGSLSFECPHCHAKNTREKNGWVYDCQSCGGDVSCGKERPKAKEPIVFEAKREKRTGKKEQKNIV